MGWGGGRPGAHIVSHSTGGLPCGTTQLAGEEEIEDSLGSTAQQG